MMKKQTYFLKKKLQEKSVFLLNMKTFSIKIHKMNWIIKITPRIKKNQYLKNYQEFSRYMLKIMTFIAYAIEKKIIRMNLKPFIKRVWKFMLQEIGMALVLLST